MKARITGTQLTRASIEQRQNWLSQCWVCQYNLQFQVIVRSLHVNIIYNFKFLYKVCMTLVKEILQNAFST